MRHILPFVGAALLCGCSQQPASEPVTAAPEDILQTSGPPRPERPTAPPPTAEVPTAAWVSVASGEGAALRLLSADGSLVLSVACLAGPTRLAVNVPGFEPVMSEDRFAFSLGEEPVTLVANPYEQDARPGVTGEGPVPDNFEALLNAAGDVRALYGSQQTGPHAPPPPELRRLLAEGCDA